MGILRSQEDGWTKEMAKFEQRDVVVGGTLVQPIPFVDGGKGGMPYAEYPKMLYRGESAMGGYRISGTRIVKSEAEELVAIGQGWSATQELALDEAPKRDRELAALAANRVNNEKWMSEAARSEAREADESTMAHVAVIPETPIRRGPGRPPKERES